MATLSCSAEDGSLPCYNILT